MTGAPAGSAASGHTGLWRTVRVAATFVALLVLLQAPLIFIGAGFWEFANVWTARLTAWSLALTGVEAQADGRHVRSSLVALEIIRECTAVYPLVIFTSAVLAFPASWRARLAGLAAGWPALLAVNQVRLVGLCWVAGLAPARFEGAHMLVGQTLVAGTTVLAFMLWLALAGGSSAARS
jgi:exosortase/archaeosortase family protein